MLLDPHMVLLPSWLLKDTLLPRPLDVSVTLLRPDMGCAKPGQARGDRSHVPETGLSDGAPTHQTPLTQDPCTLYSQGWFKTVLFHYYPSTFKRPLYKSAHEKWARVSPLLALA